MPQHDDVLKMLGLDSAPVPMARPRNPEVDLSPGPQLPPPTPPGPTEPDPFEAVFQALRGSQEPEPSDPFEAVFDVLRGVDRSQVQEQPSFTPQPPPTSTAPAALKSQWPVIAPFMRGINQAHAGFELGRGMLMGSDPSDTASRTAAQLRDIESWMDPIYAQKSFEFMNTEEGWPAFKFLLSNPSFVLSATAEAAGSTLAGAALGLAAGGAATAAAGPKAGLAAAALGVGGSSGAVEGMFKIVETIKEKGFDPTDDEQLAAALADQEIMDEAVDKAIKKGVAVGSIDALATLVGGPMFFAVRRALTKAGVSAKRATIGSGAAGVGLQAGTEGAGEALGELWSEGEIPWNEVMLESVAGGIAGAALELPLSIRMARGMEEGTPSTEEDVRRALRGILEEKPVPTFEESVEAGRTEFGFAREGESFVRVAPDYETATLEAQTTGERRGSFVTVEPGRAETVSVEQLRTKLRGEPHETQQRFADAFEATPEQRKKLNNMFSHMLFARPDELTALQEWRNTYQGLLEEGVTLRPEAMQELGLTPDLVRKEQTTESQFREPDRAFLSIGKAEDVQPGTLILERTPASIGVDFDLRKMQAGDLVPEDAGAVEKATRALTSQRMVELAQEGGSTPEAIQTLAEWLRQRTMDSSEFLALPQEQVVPHSQVEDLMQSGELKFTPDAGWTQFGVRVAKSDEAAARVKGAAVPGVYQKGQHGAIPRINTLRGQGSPLQPVKKQKDAVGRIVHAEGVNKDFADKVVGVITKLIQDLKIPYALDVYFVDPYATGLQQLPQGVTNIRSYFAKGTSLGFWHPMPGMQDLPATRPMIAIMTGSFRTPEQIATTVFHEFGHFLSFSGLMMRVPRDRMKIFAAYERFLLSTGMVEESVNRFTHRTRIKPDSTKHEYYFTFEEWFAEQIGRWAMTNIRSNHFLLRIARDIGRNILRAWKAFRDADLVNEARPEKVIEDWLKQVRIEREQLSWSDVIEQENGRVTLEENKKQLGEDATPAGAEGTWLHELSDSLGEMGFTPAEGQVDPKGLPRLAAENDRFNWFFKWALGLGQLSKVNPHIRELQVYRELIELTEVDMREVMVRAQEVLRSWNELGHLQAERLGAFLFDLTLVENWPVIRGTEQERAAARAEQQRIVNELRQKHQVSQEGMQVFGEVMANFSEALGRMQELALTEANKIKDEGKRMEVIRSINSEFARMRTRPYFPLNRYGKWTIVVRQEGEVVHFESFESKRQRDRAARILQAEHGKDNVGMGVMSDFSRSLAFAPPTFIDMIANRLNLTPEQRNEINQLKYEVAPAHSFKKRFMQRNKKAVEGFARDARRNFAHYHFHHAKHFVRVKYGQQLRDSINGLRETARTAQKTGVQPDVTNLQDIANYMQDHFDNVFIHHKPDMSQLRSAAAHWYLGLNPRAAFLNLTQLGYGSLPFLGSKFGDLRSLNALRKAATDVRVFYRKETIAGLADEDMKDLTIAFGEGFINESQAVELARTAEGNAMLGGAARGAVQEKWALLSEMSMALFQLSEQFNRKVTFIAARRLALENPGAAWVQDLKRRHPLQFQRQINEFGKTEAQALAYLAGKDATIETQYNYSRVMRPRYMRGKLGALFQFHMFVQSTMFMIGSNKGIIPRYMLIMMAIGGLMGLPGAEDAGEIIRFIAARFGKNFKLEEEILKFAKEVTHEDFPYDVISRGISRHSFGIPWIAEMAGVTSLPKFDMSRNVGMGQILPINPFAAVADPGANTERMIARSAENISGAAFGMGFRLAEAAMDTMNYGFDAKTWTRAMPSALQSQIKAGRYLWEGEERDRGGGLIVRFDRRDPEHLGEIFLQSMGFRPTRHSQAWDRRIAEIQKEQYWDWRRRFLMHAMQQAVEMQDREEVRNVRDSIRAFNREAPRGKAISSQGLRRSIEGCRERIVRTERGLPRSRAATGISEEVKQIYPDAIHVTPRSRLERD